MNQLLKIFFGAGMAVLTLVSSASAVNPGNLPLWFEAGQSQPASRFTAHAQGAEFAVTAAGAEFSLRRSDGQTGLVRMQFVSAAQASPVGINQLAGRINYFLGNDSTQWQTTRPTFAQVSLENVYPGISVIYYGNQQQLEYDFNLAAGANPETINIRFDGAQNISVDAQGALVIALNGGKIVQPAPVAYQTIAGERRPVKAGYKISEAQTVTFAVGSYDHTQPLVIDPILSFSSYFGGNNSDTAWAVAVNPTDNSIFIAGQTLSTQISNNIPFATNGVDKTFNGGTVLGDAFVAKFDSTGTNLIYCTYLGGNADDAAYALAVDTSGHAFVAGATTSPNFPVTNPANYSNFSGTNIHGVINGVTGHYPTDAFVTELETNGASLLYSSYLGGSSSETAYGLAIDLLGNAFVTGFTYSSNYPVTPSAIFGKLQCTNNFYLNANAFVTEIAAGGGQINYSTYLGGTNFDTGRAIAYNNGNVFVAGFTASTNFPWVKGLATGKYLNGRTNRTSASDAFVTMFTTSGTNLTLAYSTFLGSSNNDVARSITADASGNAYVVGWTTSTNFPVTTNGVRLTSFVRTNTTGLVIATNAFLAKLAFDGTAVSYGYSQIFGGRGVDVANGVTRDSADNIYVIGSASSTNFPVTANNIFGSLRRTNSGASDVFVTAFPSDFSTVLWSAYFGGSGNDYGNGIAVDSTNSIVIARQTFSVNFPVFASARSVRDGSDDAFIAKIFPTSMTLPALSARRSGTNVLVSWPPIGQIIPPFVNVETSTNLIATNWSLLSQPPVLTNGNYTITLNPTNPVRFFRFRQP